MNNFSTKKNQHLCAGSPCSDIILLSQLLTIGLYNMFVPIIRILLVSVQSSTVLVLSSVHIHKSVSLLISVEPAEKICVRPCAVCQDTTAIITRFLELLYVMFQVIYPVRIMDLPILKLVKWGGPFSDMTIGRSYLDVICLQHMRSPIGSMVQSQSVVGRNSFAGFL